MESRSENSKWLSKQWLQNCLAKYEKQSWWARLWNWVRGSGSEVQQYESLKLFLKTEEANNPIAVWENISGYLQDQKNRKKGLWSLLAPSYFDLRNLFSAYDELKKKEAQLSADRDELAANQSLLEKKEKEKEASSISERIEKYKEDMQYFDSLEYSQLKGIHQNIYKLHAVAQGLQFFEYREKKYPTESKTLFTKKIFCQKVIKLYEPTFLMSSEASKELFKLIKNNQVSEKHISDYLQNPKNYRRRLFKVLQEVCLEFAPQIDNALNTLTKNNVIEQQLNGMRINLQGLLGKIENLKEEAAKLVKELNELLKTFQSKLDRFKSELANIDERINSQLHSDRILNVSPFATYWRRPNSDPFAIISFDGNFKYLGVDVRDCKREDTKAAFENLRNLLIQRNQEIEKNFKIMRLIQDELDSQRKEQDRERASNQAAEDELRERLDQMGVGIINMARNPMPMH